MIRFKTKYYLMFIVVIVVCLAIASCSSVPVVNKTLPPAKTKMHLLAERIIENTPEYVHFRPGAKFAWVLFSPVTTSNALELQNEVLSLLKKKYTVYYNDADIPQEYLHHGSKGELIGYKNGFSFGYHAEMENEGMIKIQYCDWEGNLGGSNHWTRYKWMGTYWDIIEKSPLIVS